MKELRAAPGRTALISVTIGLIAILVTFLSALTAGLSQQSISALDHVSGPDTTLLIADNGSTALSGSRIAPELAKDVGGSNFYVIRDRIGDTPVVVIPDPQLQGSQATVNASLSCVEKITIHGRSLTKVAGNDLWLDHVPVVTVSSDIAAAMGEPPVGVLVDTAITPPVGTKALRGTEIYTASASYTGENLSLTTMTTLLFVISALVVGAFFMVWTIQRLSGVAISLALGAARKVIVADSIVQSLSVLVVGVVSGTVLTILVAKLAPATLPIQLTASTTVVPAALLIFCGLIGAAFSLIPIVRANPRAALAQF